MKYSRFLGIGLLLLLGVARVFAADITGTWKAAFDTQIGQQNYTYQFVVKGTTLSGKIQSEMGGTSEVLQGKVEGDKVSFVEVFKFEGNEIQITYTGRVTSDDEIKFTRQVADFLSAGFTPEQYELLVMRVRAAARSPNKKFSSEVFA